MIGLLFVLLMLLLCGGGYLWVKRLKQKKAEAFEKLKRVADGAALPKSSPAGAASAQGASSTTTGGAPPVPGEPEPVAAPEPPKLRISVEEGARYGITLRQQMESVLAPWKAAELEFAEFQRVDSEFNDAERKLRWSVNVPSASDAASVKSYTDDLSMVYATHIQAGLRRSVLARALPEVIRPLEAPLNALIQSLKPVRDCSAEELPPGLYPVVAAARHLCDRAKRAVADLAKSASESAKAAPKPRPKGPARPTYEPLLTDLAAKFEAAVAAYVEFSAVRSPAVQACDSIGRQAAESRFRQPQRPTQEEVGQYLQEIETWAGEQLTLQREAAPLVRKHKDSCERFTRAQEALKEAASKVAPLKDKEIDVEAEAAILAADRFNKDYASRLADSGASESKTLSAVELLDHASVPSLSASESVEVSNLRKLARTVGFAVAQENVAHAKWSAETRKPEPGSVRFPVLQSSTAVDQLVADFERYLGQEAVRESRCAQREATIEVAKANHEARAEKTRSSRDALGKKAEQIKKLLNPGSADELRVVILAALKLTSLLSEK